MTSLIIDTCTEYGTVAFFGSKGLFHLAEIPRGHQNSKYLVEKISEGVKTLGIELKELGSIIVTMGPGSYTGIRVGVAVARTISFATGVPLVGVSSLHGFQLQERKKSFAAVIDAKISGAYIWEGREEGLFGAPEVLALDAFEKRLGRVPLLITPNATALKEKLGKLAPNTKWEWIEQAPNVEALYEASLNPLFAEPGAKTILYLRKTEAELSLEQ